MEKRWFRAAWLLLASSAASACFALDWDFRGPRNARRPVAPDAQRFMWQGMQTEFLDEMDEPCTASVTIAVGDQAVCYAGVNGELRCAGKIYTTVFGESFVNVGMFHVTQILMSPTVKTADGNAMCVNTSDGIAYCMGTYNDGGQFGTGNTNPSNFFGPWGDVSGIVALSALNLDRICAVTSAGPAYCSGYEFGTSPIMTATSASTLWFPEDGTMPKIDDNSVWRVENGLGKCRVTQAGLACSGHVVGSPGDVVDGTYTTAIPNDLSYSLRYCVLKADASVKCYTYTPSGFPAEPPTVTSVFTQQPVLALAGNYYTSSLCAVYADGSIACMGANDKGQLGIPAGPYVKSEVIVQPPGSVDVACK